MSLDAAGLERDEAWILEDDRAAIGYYRVSLGRERAEIEELFLEPERIGHGLGRALFEHCVSRVRELGIGRLEWACERDMIGFYTAMGGQITGTSPSGIAGDEPLTQMALRVG
jgi:GNAT superfamily N-acetyltransferase